MTKSRMALAAFALAAMPAAGAGQSITAEQAIEKSREAFTPVAEIDCPKPGPDEEIVVCARPGPDPNRLPLYAPAAGRRIPGEPLSPGAAMAAGSSPCTTVGPNQRCSGGLPVLGILMAAGKALVKAIDGDD